MWFIVIVIVLIFIGVFRDIMSPERVKERTRNLEEQSKASEDRYNKELSEQYKEALIYIVEQILDQDEYTKMKKIFKQLEKGV